MLMLLQNICVFWRCYIDDKRKPEFCATDIFITKFLKKWSFSI